MFGNYASREAWCAALIGQPCDAGLPWSCFDHLGPGAVLAARVLAAADGEAGIHIMLVGPPGTGKTEFARALAARASLGLYAAGEAGENDSEPSRAARSAALRLSLALLARRRDAAVLLDEAEDLLDGIRSFGARREAVSKVFLNRMLERAPVPVLWTCNATDWMDQATLRRMTLVVRLPVPDAARRTAIWTRVLDREALALPSGTAAALAARWPVSAGVAAGSARAARLACGGLSELETALAGVADAIGTKAVAEVSLALFDPALTVCATDLDALCARLARPRAPRGWSLCLYGPPGTGKSAFARHLAKRIGLPVLQKRASDLLSMWVGGSEKAIAAAFAEARTEGALLLIDEAEALLFDRSAAARARAQPSGRNADLDGAASAAFRVHDQHGRAHGRGCAPPFHAQAAVRRARPGACDPGVPPPARHRATRPTAGRADAGRLRRRAPQGRAAGRGAPGRIGSVAG